MHTHELAAALEQLARILRDGPDVELGALSGQLSRAREPDRSGRLAVNLATLAELATIDKDEWLQFSKIYDIPIHVRPRDASRDILGKLLKYLEENPAARQHIRNRASHEKNATSPALMKALQLLLTPDLDR